MIDREKNFKKWLADAKKIHGDKYDYSKVEYINARTKVCIVCPIHGEFWQTPSNHLQGQGCPICTSNSKLENELRKFLTKENISFIEKANKSTFKWLDRLHLDFYLPDYNIAIECQGKQHFGIGGWSKHFNVEKQILRDSRKRDLCKKNNLILLYYSNLNIEYPYEVFTNKNNLLKEIKKYEK